MILPPKTKTKARISFLSLLFSIAQEILATVIWQEKEITGTHTGKEEIKLYLPLKRLITQKNPKESHNKIKQHF